MDRTCQSGIAGEENLAAPDSPLQRRISHIDAGHGPKLAFDEQIDLEPRIGNAQINLGPRPCDQPVIAAIRRLIREDELHDIAFVGKARQVDLAPHIPHQQPAIEAL